MSLEKHILDGDNYISLSERELKKSHWGINRIDRNKAIIIIIKAGDSYLLGENYIKSTDSYYKAICLILKFSKIKLNNEMCESVLSYIKICNKNKTIIDNNCFECVKKKIIIYLEKEKKYKIIIQIYEEIAYNYEIHENTEKAIKYYEVLLNYVKIEKINNNIIYINIIYIAQKLAGLYIIINNKMAAFEKYKECAQICLTNMFSNNCRIYLLYSLIVILELLTEEQFRDKLIEYKKLDPTFMNCPEYNLIRGLFIAKKIKNTQFINNVIINNKLVFDIYIIEILTNLKNNLDLHK